MLVNCFRETRRGGLVRPASKSCRFSHHPLRVPKAWHGDFAACGQRSGLLALNLANIFEKLLDQKTFACGSFFHPFRIRKAFYSNAAFHVKHFSFLFLENHSKNRKSLPILQHFVEFQKIFSDFYEIALQNFTISCKIVKQCLLSSGHKYIFLETNRQKSTGEEAANA